MSAAPSGNLAALLPERAALHPERLAIADGGGWGARRLSYGALAGEVAAVAAGIRAAGVRPGERVLLFVPMSAELYVLLLACLHAGTVAVFVDAWADRARLDRAVRTADPRLFVGTPRAQLLRLLSPAVRGIPRFWTVGGALRTARYARRPAEAFPPEPVASDHPALITFTTGSTGAPKAAVRSHAFLWAQHRTLAAHLRPHEGETDLPTLPVFVLHNLAAGVSSVLPRFDPRRPGRIRPARVHAQIVREGVATSSGSPAFYQRLAGWCEARGRRLPLRALWTGGAPVYPPLARRLAEVVDGEAHVVYGSTEAEPIATIGAAEMARAAPPPGGDAAGWGVCVGPPVSEIELRLIRPYDAPVELGADGWAAWEVGPGETGEVVVAGAHVLGGYLDAPGEEHRHKIRDGERVWHRTGDAARLDPQGRLWLMGRVSERVVRNGAVWWSTPAEARALEIPGVRHAAYLGVMDPDGAVRATLCLELAGGHRPSGGEAGVRAALDPIPVDRVVPLRRIPCDPRHESKTDAAALRALLARRR